MGNVYLITGASSDVGCALIEQLYQEGERHQGGRGKIRRTLWAMYI